MIVAELYLRNFARPGIGFSPTGLCEIWSVEACCFSSIGLDISSYLPGNVAPTIPWRTGKNPLRLGLIKHLSLKSYAKFDPLNSDRFDVAHQRSYSIV
jgi:hypothetical protein